MTDESEANADSGPGEGGRPPADPPPGDPVSARVAEMAEHMAVFQGLDLWGVEPPAFDLAAMWRAAEAHREAE